jgi:cell fate (sporulation/competence/biofilm development) regulator YlbF (YheA/YmcA/DUF963 family)
MANKTFRLITINEGEEAIIKVNSNVPITLDFNGHVVTVWAGDGMIFQRLSTNEEVVGAVEKHVVEVDDDAQTEIDEYEETQTQLEDYEEAGYTQVEVYDETPSPSVINEPPELVRYRNPVSHLREFEELQQELFGCYWNCHSDDECKV